MQIAKENNTWAGTPKKVSVSVDILSAFHEKTKLAQNGLAKYSNLNQGLKALDAQAKKVTTNEQEIGKIALKK